MSEKVIHELRIIETEDGFRVEIKGDKEQLRQMGIDKLFSRMMGGRGHGPFPHPPHHHGPMGFFGGRFGGRHGWWSEQESSEEGERKSKV